MQNDRPPPAAAHEKSKISKAQWLVLAPPPTHGLAPGALNHALRRLHCIQCRTLLPLPYQAI